MAKPAQAPHEFVIPVSQDRRPHYGGRGDSFPFGDNVQEIPLEAVRSERFDLILYQHSRNYADRERVLSPDQLRLPRIFIEHDPPLEHPTEQVHWFDDPEGLLVHVTPFNALMWNSGRTPTRIIDHGVPCPDDVHYTGELDRGIVVVNCLGDRGRRVGPDVFETCRKKVPLDLVGMQSEQFGGLGEVRPTELRHFEARYRFFFNPLRYTSMGLAVIEAMMIGMPVVGLATTEMATAIDNGVTGIVDTRIDRLIAAMQDLCRDPGEARRLGENGKRFANERFSMNRFINDWNAALDDVRN
ncbi:transferase [Planctomyces sp. SCGC AG-212-M04]|nr:transferase [Planctomyces sp. SCGC AG-212-M04]